MTAGAILRPKGHLSPAALRWLLVLGLVPIVTITLRVLALPGLVGSGIDIGFLRSIGAALLQTLSLQWVPADQRGHVLYLLFLPTMALLVTLTRLTLGIRVLGFRSILVAVGFHQSGVIPSLVLIAVAVTTIVVVRPWLRRIRLPYYARLSVVLCIVAMTMVAALLAGPFMRSDILWSAAYFPVIVLGMLAEGIAQTLDKDNLITASWRAVTTILLAFVMALVVDVPVLRDLLLQFPELALTQIVAIVLVAEFLDYRLLQDWDTRVAGIAMPNLFSDSGRYRVAVVRNRLDAGVVGRLGRQSSEKQRQRPVQGIVAALRRGGHTVKVLEGDASLPSELRKFIPPNPRTGEPGGIVFNLAYGIQGQARTTHVPALLEMTGVPYTGATPLGHALALDKAAARTLLRQAAIPTPAFRLLVSSKEEPSGLHYPLAVQPSREAGSGSRIAADRSELQHAVKRVVRRYRHEAFVEEQLAGRRIHAALLGNDPVQCLPLVETDAGNERLCPAPIDPMLADAIRAHARAAFWACGCRDYARIDFVVDDAGSPQVVAVKTLGILGSGGAFARAAARAGYSYSALVCRIVEIARARYVDGEPVRPRVKEATGSKIRSSRRRTVSPLQ